MPALKDLLKSVSGLFGGAEPDAPPASPQEALLAGDWVASTSPQIELVQYDRDAQVLRVQYPGGVGWRYDPVPEAQALAFAAGGFRMTWVWDNIRVRGSKTRHQVNASLEAFH